MKNVLLKSLMLMIILMMVVIPVCSAASTTTGFVWPTGSDYTGGYYKYGSFVGKDQSGKDLFHLGQDFKAEIGSPVYAIADGTLIEQRTDVSSYGPYEGPGGVIKILHTDSNGRQFLALYGHVNNFKLPYACGAPVRSGQVIGYIAPYSHKDGTSIPHLHFGINLVPSSVAWQGHGTSLGSWVDPMNFLKSYSPRNSNPTQQTGSISVSSWPTGASVYLDGVSYGTTPAQGSLQINSLPIGNHQLKLYKIGYLDNGLQAVVQSNSVNSYNCNLVASLQPQQQPSVAFISNPPRASVYVDNVYSGETPVSGSLIINNLNLGHHTAKFVKSGYIDSNWGFDIFPWSNSDTPITANLIGR